MFQRVTPRLSPFVRLRTMPNGVCVGVRAPITPFGRRLKCYRGSDWYGLSHTAIEHLAQFVRLRPEVLRYYRRTLIPTESFVQTVLANQETLRLCMDHGRYLQFDPVGSPSPRVLRLNDLQRILTSGCDFARKFDESLDAGVMDEIDRRVHSSG